MTENPTPPAGTAMKYTALRHKILRDIATSPPGTYVWFRGSGTSPDRVDLSWPPVRGRRSGGNVNYDRLPGPEKRALAQVYKARLVSRSHDGQSAFTEKPLALTDTGRALLAEWDAAHPQEQS